MNGNEGMTDIDVVVPDDDVKEDDIVIEKADSSDKPAKKIELDADKVLSDLEAKLAAERKARLDAEQRARMAAAQAEKAKSEVADTNFHLVESAIETLKREKELVKQNLADAHASQDFNRVAELQDALAKHNSDLNDLQRGQKAMKQEAEKASRQQDYSAPAQQQGELIDQIAASVTPRSASWINANRDALNNEKTIKKMFRAHEDAVDDGLNPDSDEYFRYIENRLGFEGDGAAPKAQKRSAPPAAPVSRGGDGMGSRPNVVRLSPEQREMAEMMGMTDQEYARNLLALEKEGKINRKH
jgi:hypothetical protein